MPPSPEAHREALDRTRIMLRPLASGMPLGFFAFGTGALITAVLDLHWIPAGEHKAAAIALLTFVMPLEGLACIFAFLSRDAAGATSMGIFSASWGVFGTFWLVLGPQPSPVLGLFTTMVTVAILAMAITGWRAKPLLAILLFVAAIRDGFLVAYLFGAKMAASGEGWCGLLLAPFSIYGALAFLLEDVNQRTVLPLFRRGPAKQSLEGDLEEQLQHVEQEAGVRNQL